MRIAVISELPQFLLGGVETLSYRQIRIWARIGHEVTVFGKTLPDLDYFEIDGHTVTLRRIHVWNNYGRLLRAASYFFSLVRLILQHKSRVDVVYCMGLGEAAATVALLKAARLSALPLVAMPGSAGPRGDVGYIRSVPGYRLIVSLLNRHCDAIVCIAPRLPADLAALGLQSPFINIPVGIVIAPPIHAPDRIGPLKFIAVGRIVMQKGFDILLTALERLGAYTDFTVEIIGAGPDFDRLMDLAARLGVSDRITWLGALPPDEVPARLLLADIFIQPSRYEGLSNAAIEAMSCNLPIIVTDCGGIDEYIDSSQGWVVPIENPEALASAMKSALSTSPEVRRKMGESCRQIVEREFDIEHTALAYIGLFSSLIKKSRPDESV